MRKLHVKSLTTERARQAYPVVHLVCPGLTWQVWRRRVAAAQSGDDTKAAGYLFAEDDRGYIFGVLRFATVKSRGTKPVLRIDRIVVHDMFDLAAGAAADALIDAAEALARRHRCSAMTTRLDPCRTDHDEVVRRMLGSRGHVLLGDGSWRKVP